MTIHCDVISVDAFTSTIYKVVIKPRTGFAFQAGQYVLACMGEKDKRAFSIASSPVEAADGCFELHIGASEHNPYALAVVEQAKRAMTDEQEAFVIDAPHGDAALRPSGQNPLILIAGGTGYSYVRSIAMQVVATDPKRPIFLYWGGKDPSQLYQQSMLESMQAQSDSFRFIPVVEQPDATWQGKTGNVLDAVMADFVSLSAYDIYIAGRFEMAGAARAQFCEEKGAKASQLYADAFSFL